MHFARAHQKPIRRAAHVLTQLYCLLIFVQFQTSHGLALDAPSVVVVAPNGTQLVGPKEVSAFYRYNIMAPGRGREQAERAGEPTNLTAITWAHAVNSQSELDDVLNCDSIDMIEADIVLGTLNNVGPDMPVMAHPPATNSDITLKEFLERIMTHNVAHEADGDVKGIKLDFKTIEVFEGALDILHEMIPQMTYPIWLNADIVSGPVNQTTSIPVDPQRFLAGSANFPQAVLSIGWTTRWGPAYTDESYAYMPHEIADMLEAIESNNVTSTGQPITFPVRAGIAANSCRQLHELVAAVNATNDCTLTIWSGQTDYVHVEKLRELIFSFGLDRVYLDVPEHLANRLDLGRNNGVGRTLMAPSMLSVGMIGGVLLLLSFWLRRARL